MPDNKLKILVVDDEAFVRDMLVEILEYGITFVKVETASNGIEAIEQIAAQSDIDIIISDMNMPEMNGVELIEKLRQNNVDIPIIILTANSEITTAVKAIHSGANDYLLKDENIEETIFISIDRVIERYKLEKQNKKLLEELARKNKELERLSFLDGLTDIPNRRYFDKVIEQEWRRSFRENSPISLIMIDIDYFKLYNDTYGHQEGDICLQLIAKTLQNSLQRSTDFVARYGGEEFAIILPDTDMNGVLLIAQKILLNIVKLKIPHTMSKIADIVTISIGLASSLITDKNSRPCNIISLADDALYEAKKAGRNCIKIANYEKPAKEK